MKARFLFPPIYRLLGWLCLAADLTFIIALKILRPGGYATADLHSTPVSGARQDITINNGMVWHNDVIILLLIFGLLFIAFSREKTEDELISRLRLDSLQWAAYVNYAIFIVCVIFIHGFDFLPVLIFNVITPLIFFIVRFQWMMYQFNRLPKQPSIS
jgi:hypothetical protein